MSIETVEKLEHVLKMNRDAMTSTGVAYVEQAIKEVEEMLRLLTEIEQFSDVYFEDADNVDALSKVSGL